MLPAHDTRPGEQVPGECAQRSYYLVWVAERWPFAATGQGQSCSHAIFIPPLSASLGCPGNLSFTYLCCLSFGYGWWWKQEQMKASAPQRRGSLQQRAEGLRCNEEIQGLSTGHLATGCLGFPGCRAVPGNPPATTCQRVSKE